MELTTPGCVTRASLREAIIRLPEAADAAYRFNQAAFTRAMVETLRHSFTDDEIKAWAEGREPCQSESTQTS